MPRNQQTQRRNKPLRNQPVRMNQIESFTAQQTDNGPQLAQQKKRNHQVIQGVGFQLVQDTLRRAWPVSPSAARNKGNE